MNYLIIYLKQTMKSFYNKFDSKVISIMCFYILGGYIISEISRITTSTGEI